MTSKCFHSRLTSNHKNQSIPIAVNLFPFRLNSAEGESSLPANAFHWFLMSFHLSASLAFQEENLIRRFAQESIETFSRIQSRFRLSHHRVQQPRFELFIFELQVRAERRTFRDSMSRRNMPKVQNFMKRSRSEIFFITQPKVEEQYFQQRRKINKKR